MRAIMLMFDSLNRRHLPPYGCDWVHAPNFRRLAARTATFDRSYVCSMPCMPARRDLHTGRPNFLHTIWSPLQPWDDSLPEMLGHSGVYTHLITDHYHYFGDGGSGYNNRYGSWELFRGQENDPWIGQVAPPKIPPNLNGKGFPSSWLNREATTAETNRPQTKTFDAGLAFLERNHNADKWLVQIETFDPHEPFTSPESYQKLYAHAGETPLFDWPAYDAVKESPEEIERVRHNYAALVSQCDANLGRLLDTMDRLDLWKDTMLIVWTDHGYLLGEHNHWAKNIPTTWNEIARTPFFLWDPRHPEAAGQRRSALVQPAIDLAPTLLRFFGLEPTADMTGRDLAPVLRDDTPVRTDAIFGYFGLPVHYTDGRHVYMRAATDPAQPYHHYNSMPLHFRGRWTAADMATAELVPPLPFTKGIPVIRRTAKPTPAAPARHLLFDLETDPGQLAPLDDPAVEQRILERLRVHFAAVHAPAEMFTRYGLS